MNSHHHRTTNQSHRCDCCWLAFSSLYSLNRHRRLETARRSQFECGFCDLKCFCQSRLEQHLNTHEDVLRFKCSFWSKRFELSRRLNQHLPHCKKAKAVVAAAIDDFDDAQFELSDKCNSNFDYNQLVAEVVDSVVVMSDSKPVLQSDSAADETMLADESDQSSKPVEWSKSVQNSLAILTQNRNCKLLPVAVCQCEALQAASHWADIDDSRLTFVQRWTKSWSRKQSIRISTCMFVNQVYCHNRLQLCEFQSLVIWRNADSSIGSTANTVKHIISSDRRRRYRLWLAAACTVRRLKQMQLTERTAVELSRKSTTICWFHYYKYNSISEPNAS